MKRILVALATLTLVALALSSPLVQGQGRGGTGNRIKDYRKGTGPEVPDWVKDALKRAKEHLKLRRGNAFHLRNPDTDLTIFSATEDDTGLMHIRLDQVYKGVPVYRGQLMVHLDAGQVLDVTGGIFEDAYDVNTKPLLTPGQALVFAKNALAYAGRFHKEPTAKLVILPKRWINDDDTPGATLTYQVELWIDDNTNATARHQYFIDARNGSVVWHFDAMSSGVGNSLYSGQVNFPTTLYIYSCCPSYYAYGMYDPSRAGMSTNTMHNSTYGYGNRFEHFYEDGDEWGFNKYYPGYYYDYSFERAGVDAQFGSMLTWDYFWHRFGRRGMDNNNLTMINRVHFGNSYNNAQWTGDSVIFGDGDGVIAGPVVSIDTVGHEWTHALTAYETGLATSGEAGAVNESFSDIFGTAIEFYSGIAPDFLIGEDWYTPGQYGDNARNMADPTMSSQSPQPDHYKKLVTGPAAQHDNSGIQNKAFYLLAQGGFHPYSRINVTGIGRVNAEVVFYRALTDWISSRTSTFYDVRVATLNAASVAYGRGSVNYNATARAWDAVGVVANPIDDSKFFVEMNYYDLLGRGPYDYGPSGPNYWTDIINQCYNDPVCISNKRVEVSRGFWESGEFRERSDVQASTLIYPPGSERPYDNRQFVRFCYRTYLRRDPASSTASQNDKDGWDFWTNDLNSHGDYNQTIRAFITSTDYRKRFGNP